MNLVQKEQVEFDNTPVVGFLNCKVAAINPTKDEIIKLMGILEDKTENFKDKEYIGETEEGQTKMVIEFWLQEELTNKFFNYRVSLIDKIQENKDGTKAQYISCTGDTSWVDDEANLQTWFTNFTNKDREPIGDKAFRKAYIGEANLYTFIKNWLSGVDYRNTEVNILMDWNKLMRGNVKELTDLIGTEIANNVVVMGEVRIVEKDGETKHYQGIYNKNVLPAYCLKFVRIGSTTGKWDTNYLVRKFVEEIGGEYGSKNIYMLDMAKPFDESMTVGTTDKVVTEDDVDY